MSHYYVVLRHGERADHAETARETLVEGDPPLTELGLIQAEIAANEILSKIPKIQTICIVSSPFLRCVETASNLAKKFNVPVIIEEGFAEIMRPQYFANGILDRVVSRTRREMLEKELGVKIVDEVGGVKPEFPETYYGSRRRVKDAWEGFYGKFLEAECVVVVSHLFVVDELFRYWTGRKNRGDNGYCKMGICQFRDDQAVSVMVPQSRYVDLQYSLLHPN